MSVKSDTSVGAATTAVGIEKVAEVAPAASDGTLQLALAATRSPRLIVMLTVAPPGCAAASVTVAGASAPPVSDGAASASGAVPVKQPSANFCEAAAVRQPEEQAEISVQLFVVLFLLHW